jgi:DNA polymerase I-like protein with 3'-5' exonuclease and polymerase domains
MAKIVALDIETSGMTWADDVLVVGAAWGEADTTPQTASRILAGGDLFSRTTSIPEASGWLHGIIAGAEWIVLHNASFDLPYLFRGGLLTPADVQGRIFDTLVMAATSGPHESMGLAQLCAEYHIDGGPGWAAAKAQRGSLSKRPSSEIAAYCEQDCVATLRLFHNIAPQALTSYTREWIANEGDFCALLARMRVRGVQLDVPFIRQRIAENDQQAQALLRDVLIPAGIPSANERGGVLNWLQGHSWRPENLTPGGEPSLNEEALQAAGLQFAGETERTVLQAILAVRGLEKETSTFLSGFLEQADGEGRVHPNFFSGGTRTWRLSSNNPNAQNIPRSLQHDLFSAGEPGGTLLALDYSQAQLRLAAMYARENQMAAAFAIPGTDIHTATAIALYGPEEGPKRRKEGKSANFAVLFGSGAGGMASNFHLDIEIANQVLEKHRLAFPRLAEGAREASKRWQERGYLILPYGKRTHAWGDDLANRKFVAWNYLIQGAEGVIIQQAMQELDRRGLMPVSQVHDKLYIDVPPGVDVDAVAAEAADVMAAAAPESLRGRTNPPITMTTEIERKRREL